MLAQDRGDGGLDQGGGRRVSEKQLGAVALEAESTEHAGESAVKDRPRLDK